MNLLYTITGYPPSIGGAQAHCHQLARQMVTRHRVQVATHWNQTRTDWLLGTTLRAPGRPQRYEVDRVPVQVLALDSKERVGIAPLVLTYYLCQGLAIDRIARQIVRHLAPLARDVTLVHNSRMGREGLSLASLRVARQLDIPFVLTPNHHPRWTGWNYRHFLQLYRQADGVIALTQAEREALVGLGVAPEKIFVTGIGPLLAGAGNGKAFRQRHNLDGPIILFLGQKYRYKGCATILDAAPAVWAHAPEARFVFIGPRTRHSRALFRAQHDARVVEMGEVDLATKTDALAACTLLCLPSSQESFGGVVVEAWAMGKPVIGGPAPAMQEVIADGVDGYVVPQEPASLAARILALIEQPAVCAEMGARGREKVQARYTWEKLAAQTEEAYRAVCS